MTTKPNASESMISKGQKKRSRRRVTGHPIAQSRIKKEQKKAKRHGHTQ